MKSKIKIILGKIVILFPFFSTVFVSCSLEDNGRGVKVVNVNEGEVGYWKNLYENDKSVERVLVQQLPEGIGDQSEYDEGHPASVIYYFKNGTIRQMIFSPEGDVISDVFWSKD